MLTQKALNDFNEWRWENNTHHIEFDLLPEILKYALIVDWLDYVSIVIDINSEYYDGYHFWWELNISNAEISESGFETRKEALQSAIKRANEIYNY